MESNNSEKMDYEEEGQRFPPAGQNNAGSQQPNQLSSSHQAVPKSPDYATENGFQVVSLPSSDAHMVDMSSSNPTAENPSNTAAGGNTPQPPIVTQPQPTAGSVNQTWLHGNMDDQQYKTFLFQSNLYSSLDQSKTSDPQQPHPTVSSGAPAGPPDQSPLPKIPPQQNIGGSVEQAQLTLVDENKKSDNGTGQSASTDSEQVDIYRSYDDKSKSEGGLNASSHTEPTQSQDMINSKIKGATGGTKPSAPPDIAKLYIKVEWMQDKRKALALQMALQTWFNTVLNEQVKEKYTIDKLQLSPDGNYAELDITPSKALEALKQVTGATALTQKGSNVAVVYFLPETTRPMTTILVPPNPQPVVKKKLPTPQVDMFVSAVIDFDKFPPDVQKLLRKRFGNHQTQNKLSLSGSLAEVETFYREVCEIVGGPEAEMDTDAVKNDPKVEIPQNTGTSGAPPAFIVPLHQYWYFSHTHKKEIGQIQEKFGVKIDAEVSVSVTAEDQTRPDSVGKASEKLVDLFQTSTTSLQSLPIPQMQLDSEIVKDVVRNIQSDQTKMALMMSADGCLLSGPKNTISGVQSRLSSVNPNESIHFGRSFDSNIDTKMEIGASSTFTRSTLDMDIKDTQEPIKMSDELWKLMMMTSSKQISEIEKKYGVKVSNRSAQGFTTIMIKSRDNQTINLESHAYRAFIHLYQKISMSAITCPVTNPFDKKIAKDELEGHRLVGVDGKLGIWKLIGLPRNLAPAIADVEMLVGKPVFDDKTKELLDYSEKSKKFNRHSRESLGTSSAAWGRSSSVDPDDKAASGNSKQKDGETKKDDDCPICMDKFTNKKKLKCGHGFCRDCLKQAEESMGEICPVCKKVYGKVKGNQPSGTMTWKTYSYDLSGYHGCGTIEINYDIPGGKQTDEHPNPGTHFTGTQRRAYLPNNAEGQKVLKLMKRAFDQKLIFTVGTSTTSGLQNMVTWNDIHHKTNMTGGPQYFGYPDPDYLKRVKEELKAKGIE